MERFGSSLGWPGWSDYGQVAPPPAQLPLLLLVVLTLLLSGAVEVLELPGGLVDDWFGDYLGRDLGVGDGEGLTTLKLLDHGRPTTTSLMFPSLDHYLRGIVNEFVREPLQKVTVPIEYDILHEARIPRSFIHDECLHFLDVQELFHFLLSFRHLGRVRLVSSGLRGEIIWLDGGVRALFLPKITQNARFQIH